MSNHAPRTNAFKSTAIDCYVKNKKSLEEVAQKFSCSVASLFRWARDLGRDDFLTLSRLRRSRSEFKKLSDFQKQIILGTLLGDGSICGLRHRTLAISHSKKQKAYLLWKHRALGCDNKISKYITGYGGIGYKFKLTHGYIEEIWKNNYRDDAKCVSKHWISQLGPLALAVWYQDDGSWNRTGGKSKTGDRYNRVSMFYTCDFDLQSIKLLCGWLESLGLKPRIVDHKHKYSIIKLGMTSTRKLWDIVAPYVILESKLDKGMRASISKCKCGRLIDYRLKICDICAIQDGIRGERSARTILLNRFGTTDPQKLRFITPTHVEPNIHWFNHKLLRAGL